MRKTVMVLAAVGVVLALLAAAAGRYLSGAVAVLIALPLGVAFAACALLAISGWITLSRQRDIDDGRVDLFQRLNAPRAEEAVLTGTSPRAGALRHWLAGLYDHPFVVGDAVVVRSYEDIQATLDAQGRLEGLPFMEEMRAFCGRPARVYRVLDRIYDYGRSRQMRRIERAVLLVGLRCDGADHDGCDAACYLVWKESWLAPAGHVERLTLSPVLQAQGERPPFDGQKKFACQYTELTTASRLPDRQRWREWIEPWILGNVTAGAFWAAVATRAFNALQSRRGGATYPHRPASGGDTKRGADALQRGDWVRVRWPAEIAATLDANGKNRGLWFESDMLKHCGQTHRVLGRVERIVDIKRTQMIPMKTPCIVLEGVHYSGEFQRFGEQHDYLYWREAWLQRLDGPPAEPVRAIG